MHLSLLRKPIASIIYSEIYVFIYDSLYFLQKRSTVYWPNIRQFQNH